MIRIGLIPIIRPLFRGSRFGLEAKSLEALKTLGSEHGFEVAYVAEAVADAAQAEAAAKAALAAQLDFLLVEHITFATGDLFTPFLQLPIPLGLWAVPEVWSSGPLPQNAICGLNLGISLNRTAPVKWFYGNPEDEWFRSRLLLSLSALRGAKALRQSRVLALGGHAPGFFAFDVVPNTGMIVEKGGLELLWKALDEVLESDVDQLAAQFDEASDYSKEQLRTTFKLELALAKVAKGYDGMALREWPEIPEQLDVMAYSAMARLSDQGHTLAPEGDVMGLAGQLALQAISGQPAILLDISHFSEKGLMLWHGGEAPKAWAGGPTGLIAHFNRGCAAVRDMALKAGIISGLRLLPGNKAVVHGGYLNGEKGFDGDSSWLTRASWATKDLTPKQFLTSWLNHRVPHHMAVSMGDHEAVLLEMCGWLGLEVLPANLEEHRLVW
jgi:L-fucose isomerase-like protein